MYSRRRLPREIGLNTLHLVPFVTVTFLCLLLTLFFTRFCSPSGVRMVMPAMSQGFPSSGVIQITVSDNAWYIDGRPVPDGQLASFLSTVSFRKPAVLIKASHTVPLESVMRLWRMCGRAGISSISLITD